MAKPCKYMLQMMIAAPWRVAVTRDEDANGPWHLALKEAGFDPIAMPIVIEGPPPEPLRLATSAEHLSDYDWVICASARSVRALSEARGAQFPVGPRAAAVGAVTAAAMRAAGAQDPIIADNAGARALWDRLRDEDSWAGRRVLIATVPGGRQELIDGLRAAGANVDAIDCYSMQARSAEEIARQWDMAQPDAALLASPSTVRQLLAAIGVEGLKKLQAIVPIGFTTATTLLDVGIEAEPPAIATFEAVVEQLVKLRSQASPGEARARVDPTR
jgi:uroporphyrinogen-III synthase